MSLDEDTRLSHGGGFSYLDLVERRGTSPHVPDAVVSLPHTMPYSNSSPRAVNQPRHRAVRRRHLRRRRRAPERGPHAGVIAVSFENMADVIGIDDIDMTVTVGPGITGPTLETPLVFAGSR